jgi:hypothetical protein
MALRIISIIFIIKLNTVFFLVYLTKCDPNASFIGIASMNGDANSYITPIDNFISEGNYYYEGAKAGRMPYVGLIYYFFRLFFSKKIALSFFVIFQTLLSSIAIYYMAKLSSIILKNHQAFWIFSTLSLISLHVTTFDFTVLSESLGISFICIFSYHYFIYLKDRTNSQLLIAAFFLCLSVLYKPYLSLIYLLIGIEFLAHFRQKNFINIIKETFIKSLITILPLLVINGPWTIRNYKIFNEFKPFQQDINAGYNYSDATLSVYEFIQSIGESYIFWDKRSAGCYFEPSESFACEYELPNRILSKKLTKQKILDARKTYISFQKKPNDSLNKLTVLKFNELKEIYVKENRISYYLLRPLILTKHFLLHSGSYFLPISPNSACFHPSLWVLKISQSILYYMALFLGFFGIILLFRNNPKTFIIVSIPIYLILLFPVFLARTEFRYFHLAYPFLLVGLTFTILKFKNYLNYNKIKQLL